VRPKLVTMKSLEEAAVAVDDMFNLAFQNAGIAEGDDSGEDSGDEDERREVEEDDDEETPESPVSPFPIYLLLTDEVIQNQFEERAPSPEQLVVLSAQENLGPSEEAEAEFAKELAKMVADSSAESRKVDKKTALAMWDSAVLPPTARKKRMDENDEECDAAETNGHNVMNFTVITKRGSKQHTRHLAVPAASALAVHTRTAQLQDKVEQQHLKRLVLDYEQREEAEEFKALEARNRAGAIKIRYTG